MQNHATLETRCNTRYRNGAMYLLVRRTQPPTRRLRRVTVQQAEEFPQC